jgi:hypothetical protein
MRKRCCLGDGEIQVRDGKLEPAADGAATVYPGEELFRADIKSANAHLMERHAVGGVFGDEIGVSDFNFVPEARTFLS